MFPHFLPPGIQFQMNAYILFVFAYVHARQGYGLRKTLIFIFICFLIGYAMENLSVITGFPFGRYYYTDILGPKLFLVPIVIGPAYFAVGYLSWTLARVLIGFEGNNMFWQPFIAAFIMVAWDLTIDPSRSTISKCWIWLDGGAYFGVPLSNFAGWFFTVYLIFQSFALCLWLSGNKNEGSQQVQAKSYWLQAALMYGLVGLFPLLTLLKMPDNIPIADATGKIWFTGDIYQSLALISLFTMIFISVLSCTRIIQRPPGKGLASTML